MYWPFHTPAANNLPAASGDSLGSTSATWANAYFSSGATLNFGNGNAVITHSNAVFNVTTGDFRVTTVGTNAQSVALVGGLQTLTNKTLTTPTLTASASQTTSAMIWYDSTQIGFAWYLGATSAGTRLMATGCQFGAYGSATQSPSNSTSEATFANSFIGATTVPANVCVVGKAVTFLAGGVFGTTGTPTLLPKVKKDNTTAITGLASGTTMASGVSNGTWELEVTLTFSSSSQFYVTGKCTFVSQSGSTSTTIISPLANSSPQSFTLGNAFTLDLTMTWGTANASNVVTCFYKRIRHEN